MISHEVRPEQRRFHNLRPSERRFVTAMQKLGYERSLKSRLANKARAKVFASSVGSGLFASSILLRRAA